MSTSLSRTTNSQWFALYVKPKHEKMIASASEGKGIERFSLHLFAIIAPESVSSCPCSQAMYFADSISQGS
jgi:hypothetical protein